MAKTIPQLEAAVYTYLTGADLVMWCAPQILISQDVISPTKIATAVLTAIGELKAAARTKYNLDPELAKTGDARDVFVVKLISILSVRNAIGNSASFSEPMILAFKWADDTIKAIRAGQNNLLQPALPLPTTDPITGEVNTGPASRAEMVPSSWSTLG